MSKRILFHHGSPGTPADFRHLVEHLSKETKNIEIDYIDRNKKNNKRTPAAEIQVGYSFGCVEALKAAAHNPENTQAVVLVAPYVFVNKKMSGLQKTLMGLPILSDLLLSKIAPKAIQGMLQNSSAPCEIPASYQEDAKCYTIPSVLKKSMFEKENIVPTVENAIQTLKEKNVPILLIRGAQDQTSPLEQQITPLKNKLNIREYCLENAGHALLWTHPQRLSEILSEVITNAGETMTENKLGYFAGEHTKNNVCSFLDKHLEEIPDRPILSWVSPEKLKTWSFNINDPLPHDSVTVRELDQLVSRIGAGFTKLGIKKGDRVVVFVPMSLYLYAAMFALQKIGAIAVFLDSWARRDQLGLSAEAVDPIAMVSVEQAFHYMAEVKQIQSIPLKIVVGPAQGEYSARLESLMQTPELASITPVEREHTALVTFTTGSSGTPKGANRTHRFLAAQHYALNRHLPYESADADLPVFPIFSLNNLAAGVKTVIPAIDVGTPNDHDPLILIAQMKSTNTTCTTLSPSLLNAVSAFCLKHEIKLPFLRRIITGGAPVSRDDLIRITSVCPNAEVLVLYGSTEVEPMAHIEAKEMINQKDSDDPEWVEEGVNVGHMDEGLEVKYLKISKDPIYITKAQDWSEWEMPKGKVGEIIVAGEHVCESYFNNEEAFFRAKIRDERGVVWHRTGDLGRVDEQGNLWLVGRVHNAIKRGDTYAFPVRSEIIMKKLPFVKLCAYLGVEDATLGERTVCVYTVDQEKGTPSEETIEQQKNEIARIMEKNQVPVDQIVFTNTIPMDPRHHSKVEYTVLREQLKSEGKL
jgi:olefin beta-lactone synthetase